MESSIDVASAFLCGENVRGHIAADALGLCDEDRTILLTSCNQFDICPVWKDGNMQSYEHVLGGGSP